MVTDFDHLELEVAICGPRVNRKLLIGDGLYRKTRMDG
jgi:hypothetical protein